MRGHGDASRLVRRDLLPEALRRERRRRGAQLLQASRSLTRTLARRRPGGPGGRQPAACFMAQASCGFRRPDIRKQQAATSAAPRGAPELDRATLGGSKRIPIHGGRTNLGVEGDGAKV